VSAVVIDNFRPAGNFAQLDDAARRACMQANPFIACLERAL
jgi:hypothetical protein